MAKAKKFGTFAGVFTPSLLTILGVIMYLRLGWVVGESGLIASLGIILIAHVISITTGLSVSSVATDKKVKAGGLYYMLSRSLGLPIGGSIGITLFIGTALSISLYIVGFSDSFNNSIGFATEGLGATRITGSITLTLLTVVALISTSIALKAQFYIMAAIFLSLISIVVGVATGDHGLNATMPSIGIPKDGLSLAAVFAIFFPAVTGFTAGVAMSGDLQDPKRSIPVGTMASIGVGLVVYIGLACFIAYSIDSDALRSDYNILSKVAYFAAYGAPLVMAGIWGATLSSALGGVLGGPRILQAMSVDRVTPKALAKGAGKNNEPRRALILTFVLAELGVLVGELDLIARVVSMFYLTAYGFINLTSALESWSGSDFRPQFKIPRIISILGAVATFVVMFQLDFVAMLVAFLIIGIIFIILTRKQISIGFSDIWQGVWSEVLRTALFKVSRKGTDQKNWRPNVLLFTGDAEKRAYMLELGQSLVSRLGVVSSFELKEDPNVSGLMPVDNALQLTGSKGIFNREFLSDDVYEGIGSIASTYGFSGVTPNTILMGWSRYTGAPYKFTKLLKRFSNIDYNVLIMDYDRENGFRNKDRIDIWFRGKGRNLSFALTIVRFLITSDEWLNAHVRILTDIEKSQINSAEIYKSMEVALEELRLNAEVKIVSSAQKNQSFLETLQAESVDASLVMLGLSDIEAGKEQEFYERTDKLCDQVGSVLLYRASKDFREIDLGIPEQTVVIKNDENDRLETEEELEILVPSTYPEVAGILEWSHRTFEEVFEHYFQEYFNSVALKDRSIYAMVGESVASFKTKIIEDKPEFDEIKLSTTHFLEENASLIQSFITKEVDAQSTILTEGGKKLREMTYEVFQKIPTTVTVKINKSSISASKIEQFKKYADTFSWVQIQLSSKEVVYKIPLRKMFLHAFSTFEEAVFKKWSTRVIQDGLQIQSDLQKMISKIQKSVIEIEISSIESEESFAETTAKVMEEIIEELSDISGQKKVLINSNRKYFITKIREYIQNISDSIEHVSIYQFLQQTTETKAVKKQREKIIASFPQRWKTQRTLHLNFLVLEFHIKAFQLEFEAYMTLIQKEIEDDLQDKLLLKTKTLGSILQTLETTLVEDGSINDEADTLSIFQNFDYMDWLFGIDETIESNLNAILSQFPKEIELENPQEEYTEEEAEGILLKPSEIVKFILQNEYIAAFSRQLNDLSGYVGYTQGVLRDIARIVAISIDNLNEPKVIQSKETKAETISLLQKEGVHLENIFEELTTKKDFFFERINYHLHDTFDKLDPYFVLKSAPNLDEIRRAKGRVAFINNIQNRVKKNNQALQDLVIKLRYGRSQGLLLAQKIQQSLPEQTLETENLIKGIQQILPSEQVLSQLPLYYRQLFLRERNTSKDLWLERDTQRLEIKDALYRYDSSKSGALLITGDIGSGKTFLAEQTAQAYCTGEKQNIYIINAPYRGSVNPRVFKSSLARATGFSGGIEAVFDQIPKNSVILFDDLELWWERTAEGLAVIKEIEEMINRYSSQVFFIFTIGSHTFNFINHFRGLNSLFYKVMECNPFSAEELQKLILFRQHSSRIHFYLDEKEESQLSRWKLAGFFNYCFDISEGNVSIALQTWISSITSVDGNKVAIEKKKKTPIDFFSKISPDLIIILVQCILHKRITAPKLAKILSIDSTQIVNSIYILKRYQLLEEKNGVLSVNQFLRPYLIKSFRENEIL